MNPLPPNADELVSAYLDGEAAPDEIALVESNPELLEHVESLRSLTAPLTEPVGPSPAKEAHLSAALGLFDELFAAEGDTSRPDQPRLAAVSSTDLVGAPEPPQPKPEDTGNVVSFDNARERRRRKVSPTVIAAAIAAVALLLFAVLSAGGRNDDVATSSFDTATQADSSSSDAASGDDVEEAMEEEAMEEAEGEGGGLSEASEPPQASLPAPESARAQEDAMEDDEAMDDEEAMEEVEEAMADEAMDDEEAMEEEAAASEDSAASADEDASDQGLVGTTELYSFGDISEPPALQEQLDALGDADLRFAMRAGLEGLFPRCRGELDVLPADENSLIGEGFVDQVPVEVHLVESASERRIYVIAADECRVVFDFALGL